jgi:hypothetical protein
MITQYEGFSKFDDARLNSYGIYLNRRAYIQVSIVIGCVLTKIPAIMMVFNLGSIAAGRYSSVDYLHTTPRCNPHIKNDKPYRERQD